MDVGVGIGIFVVMFVWVCGCEGGVVVVEEYASCAVLVRKIVGGDGIDVWCV